MQPDGRTSFPRLLRRVWLELRFVACASMQLDFEHPRVQRIVREKWEFRRGN